MKKALCAFFSLLIIFTSLPVFASGEKKEQGKADIVFTGDLLCLNAQLSSAGSGYNFNYVFDSVREDFLSSDLTVGNLETCLAGEKYGLTTPAVKTPVLNDSGEQVFDENGKPLTKTSVLPKINAPISFGEALKKAGYDFVVTANNHTMDRGNAGVKLTVDALDSLDITHTGTSKSGEDNIHVLNLNGIKVSILSYTMFLNSGNEAPASSYTVNIYSDARSKNDISKARQNGAEYIIVYMHWGDENKPVNALQRQTAQKLANAGADLIIGSHPHVLQTTEYFRSTVDNKKVLCVYSLGNFISSMASEANKQTISLHIRLRRWQSGKIDLSFAEYKPYYSGTRFSVSPASSAQKAKISAIMGENLILCDKFRF